MRVAIIHNQFSDGGGMEAYMQGLVQGFLAAGDEVHIHTYKVDSSFAADFSCTVHKSHLFYLPRRWKKYAFLKSCNDSFSGKDYDLSLSLTRTFAADIAIVGGVHPASTIADKGKRHILKRFHDKIEMAFERAMFNRVPFVVAHSKSIAEDIIEYYPNMDASKISVLYPPVDTEFFRKMNPHDKNLTSKEYALNREKIHLLFPSTGHKRKGFAELLAAFRRLDPARYQLLVTGESLRNFSDIPENVRYLGYITNLSHLYSVVDYTILPSHYEPFGLAVIESLECGTPVIVTKNVGAAELLSEKEAVILPDNQPDTILHAIKNLKKRTIVPGFVKRNGLLLSNHIECLKELVS